ncbi:MAG: hypothetical protein WC686_01340 [Candidatus Shapirobacteria bacterium]|jgi:hypothetical protein
MVEKVKGGEPKEKEQIPGIKQLLIDAVLSPKVAIPSGIETINIETLDVEGEKLTTMFLCDPSGGEYGIQLVVRKGKLLATKKVFRGQITSTGAEIVCNIPEFVRTGVVTDNSPRQYVFNMLWAAFMHSHAIGDCPQSPTDVCHLVRGMDDPKLQPCSFVTTTTDHLLVFRSAATPNLDTEKLEQLLAEWNFAVDHYLNYIERQKTQAADGGKLTVSECNYQSQILAIYAKRLNLLLYKGNIGEGVVRKVDRF